MADSSGGNSSPQRVRVTEPFDSDWRFSLGDAAKAQDAAFDDSAWRRLNVPHDWSIEGTIDQANSSGKSEAFLPTGVGWYRKHFALPASFSGRRVFIQFDGVMANSDVFINGFNLGHRPYGYVSFQYDMTGHLNFGGQDNVLSARVDDSAQPASRWYAGSGIERHVRLVVTDPVHLDEGGVYITTPKVAADQATVHVTTHLVNESDQSVPLRVETTVYGPDGQPVAADPSDIELLPGGQSIDIQQDIFVKNPRLWNLDQPNLYTALSRVTSGTRTLDDTVSTFGIREFHFDPDTGFWLNGKNFKIFGCAIHCEAGAFGGAVPLGVWERTLAALKSVGCNAIRTAHNPPAPEFLDLCDRMGFLVMDEMFDVWTVGKTPLQSRTVLNDYHSYFRDWWQKDVTDTILRDRNHPSIILWSAGNEIHDITPTGQLGFQIFTPLRDLIHQLDSSRPVTLAVLRPNINNVYTNGFSELMDVVGQNYRENEIIAAHQQNPARKIIGTENRLDVATWRWLRDNPAYSGQFLWTGVDYLGESPAWPAISHVSGLFDRTLLAHASAYQRKSWWTSDPVVRVARVLPAPRPTRPAETDPGIDTGPAPGPQYLSDWTPRDGLGYMANLEVYTNCDSVELFLNGKSLGSQNRHPDDSPLTWRVAYEPGDLKAVGTIAGKAVATHELRTAGQAAKVVLSIDQANLSPNWDDVAFARARVVDAEGIEVPDATNQIYFQISGPAIIAAVDNGDVQSHEPFRGADRHAYQGSCLAIIQATAPSGKITLTASADGLESSSADIAAVSDAKR
ncbi:MAG: glycoside hydrolase family 2 TIM barrel-domain containing protein [Tepidisphaeraceae bacterium]